MDAKTLKKVANQIEMLNKYNYVRVRAKIRGYEGLHVVFANDGKHVLVKAYNPANNNVAVAIACARSVNAALDEALEYVKQQSA